VDLAGLAEETKSVDDDDEDIDDDDEEGAILSMDDTSITAPSTGNGSLSTLDDFMSAGLSQFVFLNPRWLVAAVACILRHDLDREIKETRRQASVGSPRLLNHAGSFNDAHLNCPVITAEDACLLWQAKRITKKAAERAQEYSNNMTMTPFEFLQQLLIRFGVFVPIDLSIEKAFLGGKEYTHLPLETTQGHDAAPSSGPPTDTIAFTNDSAAKFFFLPSLLGPSEPSDAWTYKSTDSWKTTLCHSVLFPDGVPPGLMERLTASVLSSLYAVAQRDASGFDEAPESIRSGATYEGQLVVKEVLCWRTASYLKIGSKARSADGTYKESIVEIFVHLADRDSHLCVGSSYMGVGTRRLIVSGRGQGGDGGRKTWKGGYLLVCKCISRAVDNYGGLEYERHGFCPECLSKKAVSEASSWEFTKIRSAVLNQESTLRCQHGHQVDIRLVAGPHANLQRARADAMGEVTPGAIPVQDLLRSVVVVGLWDGRTQKVVRVGSGFIVDKKRGLIVTASHTLMNIWGDKNYPFGEDYYGLRQGKVVIGVIPEDSRDTQGGRDMAVFRYFAKIVAKDPNLDNGECVLDACVLKITTRLESDIGGDGEGCGDQPERLLLNDPRAMKHEHLQSLKVTERCERDEQVRILGYNQGGEGLLRPGESLNRSVDFARGYVCMRFAQDQEGSAASADGTVSIRTGGAGRLRGDRFRPKEEIVVICPTIGGHSGGPCVNQQGEVIGILSRADPAESQRCYISPTSEWKFLLKQAKNAL
jgi:Trypsin-like peptidase domain